MAMAKIPIKALLDEAPQWQELRDASRRVSSCYGTSGAWGLTGDSSKPRRVLLQCCWAPIVERAGFLASGASRPPAKVPTSGHIFSAPAPGAILAGAVRFRVGDIEGSRREGPLRLQVRLGGVERCSRPSIETYRMNSRAEPLLGSCLQMSIGMRRVCLNLADRGWTNSEIADLVEWPEADVELVVKAGDPTAPATVGDGEAASEARWAHRVDDVLWLPLRDIPGEVVIQVLGSSSAPLAQASVPLVELIKMRGPVCLAPMAAGTTAARVALRVVLRQASHSAVGEATPAPAGGVLEPEAASAPADGPPPCEEETEAANAPPDEHRRGTV